MASDDVPESGFVPDDGPRTHDSEKHDDTFNAALAKAVQESILTFQQSLRNDLKKKMRVKLVSLWAAAHACRGVDWQQLKELTDQCKINDDGTLADNLELGAGIIGSRQKTERENLAKANLASAKSDAQRDKFKAEVDLQEKSLPRATLCPALKVLIEQQEVGALDRIADAEGGGAMPIEPHAGASYLTEMVIDIRKKGHVMLHVPTLDEWRAMGLYQYHEFAEVWSEEFRLLKAIDKHRIRDWIGGLKPDAVINGPEWWAAYARKCGYVERDDDGKPLRDANGKTIPLVFDDRFEVDHIILSSSAHESKDYLLSPILDHPDNYMIVYKGPNQHPLFQKAFGKLCLLKGYLLGAIGAQHVTNAHQHRQRSLELNRQALQKAAKKFLSEDMKNQYLKPYTTAHKARQEKNMKRLVGATQKRNTIADMFEAASKRARIDEGASSAAGEGETSETAEEEAEEGSESDEEMLPDDGARTPPGPPPPPEEKTSNIGGVSWFKTRNKWRVQTTQHGIHPKGANGEWSVWTNEPQKHVGLYASKAEAEAVNAPEQEARGRQWCAEVEATKGLPYMPWCCTRIVPPADWVQGKQYATIQFGLKGGPVGPVVVTVSKCIMYTDKKGVTRQQWQTNVSKTFRKATGAAPPPEATTGDSDASDDDEAVQAENDVKVPGNAKGPVLKPDGSVPAAGDEWTDADKKKWRVCASGQMCAAKHGRTNVMNVTNGKGNKTCDRCQEAARGTPKRGVCQWMGGCDTRSLSHHHKGYNFCTDHWKRLWPKVEAVHGKGYEPPKGFDFAPFYPPPSTSAPSAAATTQ